MTESEFSAELLRVFEINGLSRLLTDEAKEKFYLLTERMLSENEKYNLTAIREPKKIILNHYADCASIAPLIENGASIIDVGCGAGFPSLPLAILRPDLKILAIDSTAKRINYVSETARLLSLGGITAQAMRAEDGARDGALRECFDYATARAVARLSVLSELCLPFVKPRGKFIAMKGKSAAEELSEAMHGIGILGAELQTFKNVMLSDGEEVAEHPLIVIEKKKKTPEIYPRAYAKIVKKPL